MERAPGALEFLLNARPVRIDPPFHHRTLLDFLRAQGLTGAKEGCAEGECGACTVLSVGGQDGGSAYRPINSCLMLLPMAAGHEIYTVEHLATHGRLNEAQEAMAAAGGSQCGYCTPGFVMSLVAEHYRPGRDGPCDPLALAGNLCRCTGYRPIRDAARALGPMPFDGFAARTTRPAPRLAPVRVEGFSRPSSVEACAAILAGDSSAVLVAGGTDLGVDANLRGHAWPHLVSLESIDELREFSQSPEAIRIGAALPLNEIGRRWRDAPPVFAEWLGLFASPPIRNRATLGGNLATASPVGDGAPLLLALDATVHIAGAAGRRRVPLATFFTGYRRTVLAAGEFLTHIDIPRPLPARVGFYKVARRRLDDISTVAAALAIHEDDRGRIRRARFAFGGMAATPIRLGEAEAAVEGERWTEAAVARVQDLIARTLRPITDHRGSKEFRLEVSQRLIEKFYWERTA